MASHSVKIKVFTRQEIPFWRVGSTFSASQSKQLGNPSDFFPGTALRACGITGALKLLRDCLIDIISVLYQVSSPWQYVSNLDYR